MYYKSHDRRKFYFTLCHTAKQNQRYNLIQSTQNDSISVEHNFKTLVQNKFNTGLKFYFLSKWPFLLYLSLSSSSLSAFSFSSVSLQFNECVYRQTPRDGELTRITRLFSNSLENMLMLEPHSIYANILLQ